MKKIIVTSVIAAFLAACSSTTQITGAWKNPKHASKAYASIFVASLSSDNVARATVESDIAGALERQGISVYKSMDEFPPSVRKDSMTKEDIIARMRNKNAGAILTITLLRKETESRYINDPVMPYTPFPRFSYYYDFGGYYSYWHPYMLSQGYYEQNHVYYLETNLYDSETEQLVWSAQSKTYDPVNLQSFSQEFSKVIVQKLKEDGLLKPRTDISTSN